jgi:hypothetical protein
MYRSGLQIAARALAGFALALCTYAALADQVHQPLPQLGNARLHWRDSDRWYFQTSAVTVHFDPNPDHNNDQQLLNVEWQNRGRWVLGGAYFQNSFGQPCQYVYGGRMWRPFARQSSLYLKLTGGVVHGYKGTYQNNIPLNGLGVAPALLPAVGFSGRRFASEVVMFGTSGLMFNVGFFLN